jgi:D-alanyl-D-alanine carboxypeptidase
VQKGAGQLYRARFRGFDATAAASTCLHLRRLQIDCFVVKTQ